MQLTIIMAAGLAAVVAVIITLLVSSNLPTRNYSIDIDPMKDEQSLFVNARVILTNNGKMPLTNVSIDYGGAIESISLLSAGEKVSLSPPAGTELDLVTVTTNEGINVTKEYRKPIKLPGMIGS
ncbi:MAG TPA: hypothetical protein VIP70_13035 [Nitrososphaeraceae archaeon]|jgi:hypothetical protein